MKITGNLSLPTTGHSVGGQLQLRSDTPSKWALPKVPKSQADRFSKFPLPNFAGRQISRLKQFALRLLQVTIERCSLCALRIFQQLFRGSGQQPATREDQTNSQQQSGQQTDRLLARRQAVQVRPIAPLSEALARILRQPAHLDLESFSTSSCAHPLGDKRSNFMPSSQSPSPSNPLEPNGLGGQFREQYRDEVGESESRLRLALANVLPGLTNQMEIDRGDGLLLTRFVTRLTNRPGHQLFAADRQKIALMARITAAEGMRIWQQLESSQPDHTAQLRRCARQFVHHFSPVYSMLIVKIAQRALLYFPNRVWPREGGQVEDHTIAKFASRLQLRNEHYFVFGKAVAFYSVSLPLCHENPTLGDIPAVVARHFTILHICNAAQRLGRCLLSAEFLRDLEVGKPMIEALTGAPQFSETTRSGTCALIWATLHCATQCWWVDRVGKLIFSYALTHLFELTILDRWFATAALLSLNLVPLAPVLRVCSSRLTWDLEEIFAGEKFHDALEVVDWLDEGEFQTSAVPDARTNAQLLRQLAS